LHSVNKSSFNILKSFKNYCHKTFRKEKGLQSLLHRHIFVFLRYCAYSNLIPLLPAKVPKLDILALPGAEHPTN